MDMVEFKKNAISEYCHDCLRKIKCGYNKMEVVDFAQSKPCRHKEKTKALKT